MTTQAREKYLKLALLVIGLIFVVIAYPLTHLWPGGWLWGADEARHRHNIDMMLTVYAVVGVFAVLASINPRRYLSFIGFLIWSSLAHGGIMLLMALGDVSVHWQHLLGDVPALIGIGVLLGWLCPQALRFDFVPRAADNVYPQPTLYTNVPQSVQPSASAQAPSASGSSHDPA
ncbi:DUF6632 domain-containing protein [Sinimarinibacterium sp. NLF-5-8]|uniref:DUF6632 domain-containing protein n=1 Tax=Sinimarinibacterium sp. NLF-5-8 TaxID=2698684 RepID=UPI00137C1601|nr:DUF6632 domain-containing protein [Sinimarinibacterium sp. NLF-5-8]QHS09513.1 hypothetical protein GT972_04630 [Sinimarinibacterium sp. NLF-5-8]